MHNAKQYKPGTGLNTVYIIAYNTVYHHRFKLSSGKVKHVRDRITVKNSNIMLKQLVDWKLISSFELIIIFIAQRCDTLSVYSFSNVRMCFFLLFYITVNVFYFRVLDCWFWQKKAIWSCHLRLWERVMGILSHDGGSVDRLVDPLVQPEILNFGQIS